MAGKGKLIDGGIALLFGALYAIGFQTGMEGLIAASESSVSAHPFVALAVIEIALFGGLLGLTKWTRLLQDPVHAKIIVLAAGCFATVYFGRLGGVMDGILAGLGGMTFAAPSIGAFLLRERS